MTIADPKLANDLKGIQAQGNYAGAANDDARVQILIDMIAAPATQEHRGFIDQISPTARISLLVELEAMQAAVT